ncbi:EAL domain-containing protein, partial [bacterium]|nr:EAL domain-containing protein [bacterium]
AGPDRPAAAAALLSYPVAEALAPYRKLVLTLLAVFALGLVVLVAGGLAIARNLTRPLRELAGVTRRVAEGDYRSVLPPTRERELADLADNFNRMVVAVQEREGRLRHQAEHDADTGLPNRLGLASLLTRREIMARPYAVVMAEVQQLPELRTVLDHQSLNALLRGVGERLERLCGAPVTRVATEAFVVLIDPEPAPDVVASIIRNGFLTPFQVAGTTVDVGLRLGLVDRDGAPLDLATLLQRAHAALDRARTAPDGTAWYDPSAQGAHERRLSLMSDLREGLRAGEVQFAYQPKFDCRAGRITAVEALVRWHSPTRGFVPPDDFIPLAERTGNVRHLTHWALEQAVARIAAWRGEGHELAVAVNISATDLADRGLVGRIRDLLQRHRVPAPLLHLELTESAVMDDPGRALDLLGSLSGLGVRLAIDDFGAGYSSLGYLKRLPVDELKIDKSFVMNLAQSEEDRILVRSTIDLGHNLGLRVTAEGVEDAATVDLLRGYGCDMLQGYHIGRPTTVAELENLLREESHV